MSNFESEQELSKEVVEIVTMSSIGITSSYEEDPEIAALVEEMGSVLKVPTHSLFFRSAVPPELIDIQLYRDVLKDLIVAASGAGITILTKNLFRIWEKKKNKGEQFEVRFTIKSLSENHVLETTSSFSAVSEEELRAFLNEGVEKAYVLADRVSTTYGESVSVSVECKGKQVKIKQTLVRGLGYIEFESFL
jgi:hypothetical protein